MIIHMLKSLSPSTRQCTALCGAEYLDNETTPFVMEHEKCTCEKCLQVIEGERYSYIR